MTKPPFEKSPAGKDYRGSDPAIDAGGDA